MAFQESVTTKLLEDSVNISIEALRTIRSDEIHPTIYPLINYKKQDFDLSLYGLDHRRVTDTPQLLPPVKPKAKLVLILDIDETMVSAHCHTKDICIRPGLIEFLNYAMENSDIELLIWTAAILSHGLRCLYAIQTLFKHYYPTKDFKLDGMIHRGPWFNQSGKNVRTLNRNHLKCLLVDNSLDHVCESKNSSVLVQNYDNMQIYNKESNNKIENITFGKIYNFCEEHLKSNPFSVTNSLQKGAGKINYNSDYQVGVIY
jgi:hypothetical protein